MTSAGRLPKPFGAVYTCALSDRETCRLAVYAPMLSSVSARHRPSDANHLLMVFDDRLLLALYNEALVGGACRHAVYAPPLTDLPANHSRPPAGHLLMVFDDHFFIGVEGEGAARESVLVPLDDLVCVEMGDALLFCWMKLVYGRGTVGETEILFNLVGRELFTAALSGMRRGLDAVPGVRTAWLL